MYIQSKKQKVSVFNENRYYNPARRAELRFGFTSLCNAGIS